MINLQITEAGQNDVNNMTPLYFSHFIASNSFDIEDMEDYRRGTYQGNTVFKEFPIAYLNITPKGKIYSIGHTTYMLDHTVVDIVGAVETYKLDKSFEINSIGLIAFHADHPNDSWYSRIFAFGSLELNTYPLPVNEDDTLTYIIPFQVNYGDWITPEISAPDNLTPWKTFLDHTNKEVTNPTQVHNLYIDLQNLKFRVDNTSFPIPVQGGGGGGGDIDARIRALQEALRGAVHYNPLIPITSTTTFAAIDAGSNQILNSTVKVSSMTSSASQTALAAAQQQVRTLWSGKSWCWVYKNSTGSSGWTTIGDKKRKVVYTDFNRGPQFHPMEVIVIPHYTKQFVDCKVTYAIEEQQNNPGYFNLVFYIPADVTPTSDIYYQALFLVDIEYYNHPHV